MTGTFRRLFSDVADFNACIENNVGGIRVVQAFGNEKFEKEQFAVNNARFRTTKLMAYKIMALNSSISYMLMRLVTLFVLICGTWFVLQGELTYGGFIGFVLLTNIFFRPIEKINAVIESYPKGIAGFKRYVELLETEPDIVDSKGAMEVKHVHGDIQYNNITFGYENKEPILNDISLNIHAGETVAFVAPSGAGKQRYVVYSHVFMNNRLVQSKLMVLIRKI